jgi:hypothetical protein
VHGPAYSTELHVAVATQSGPVACQLPRSAANQARQERNSYMPTRSAPAPRRTPPRAVWAGPVRRFSCFSFFFPFLFSFLFYFSLFLFSHILFYF